MKKIFFSLLAIFFGSAYKANLPFFAPFHTISYLDHSAPEPEVSVKSA